MINIVLFGIVFALGVLATVAARVFIGAMAVKWWMGI